jgi:hypothetical protein
MAGRLASLEAVKPEFMLTLSISASQLPGFQAFQPKIPIFHHSIIP